jgi:cupin 2 domain-containing protein
LGFGIGSAVTILKNLMIQPRNLFTNLPPASAGEVIEPLHSAGSTRIERIISHGQASPPDFWYDQQQDEWVLVLRGEATLEFDPGGMVEMKAGDHLTIPRHHRHRVARTTAETLWLAVYC